MQGSPKRLRWVHGSLTLPVASTPPGKSMCTLSTVGTYTGLVREVTRGRDAPPRPAIVTETAATAGPADAGAVTAAAPSPGPAVGPAAVNAARPDAAQATPLADDFSFPVVAGKPAHVPQAPAASTVSLCDWDRDTRPAAAAKGAAAARSEVGSVRQGHGQAGGRATRGAAAAVDGRRRLSVLSDFDDTGEGQQDVAEAVADGVAVGEEAGTAQPTSASPFTAAASCAKPGVLRAVKGADANAAPAMGMGAAGGLVSKAAAAATAALGGNKSLIPSAPGAGGAAGAKVAGGPGQAPMPGTENEQQGGGEELLPGAAAGGGDPRRRSVRRTYR